MAKIFDVLDWLKNHPNRNNFDLSFKVHGSFQFGKLYPVLCKPVVPTDSFRIDTAVSLRFTPMPFPTQSNMRVVFHYFYVRTKNIWKNFPNWLEQLEEHEPPYIDFSDRSKLSRGSLADYLGVPIGFHAGETIHSDSVHLYSFYWFDSRTPTSASTFKVDPTCTPVGGANSTLEVNQPYSFYNASVYPRLWMYVYPQSSRDTFGNIIPSIINFNSFNLPSAQDAVAFDINSSHIRLVICDSYGLDRGDVIYDYVSGTSVKYSCNDLSRLSYLNSLLNSNETYYIKIGFDVKAGQTLNYLTNNTNVPFKFSGVSFGNGFQPRSLSLSDPSAQSPYYGTNVNTTTQSIKVSALPFRAYESIYNAFYRNSQGVQPFQVGGVTKYNQYVSNDGDGLDATNYDFFYHNWELDAYTSCLLSPQQGNAVRVGITEVSALGQMRVETPDGHEATVQLNDEQDGVSISNLYGETPEARAYALRAASSGFTIPEFRDANALQRFLEMNIRKGFKYIDFIEGHFGKKPSYAEMDMPEFLGGFTQRITVNEISNTNGLDSSNPDSTNSTLGAIAGQARAIGASKHGVNHYFDDFGFIVGIMCVIPDNAYDCILPRHFNLKNPLDIYFPEFSQLSYQPLTHEEFCPVQTANDPTQANRDLFKVFGYQRPNHDLVWYPDEVHGLFTDASGIGNSIICRRFSSRPDLSDSFLKINPQETDTIFNYTFGDSDVMLGEIVFKISAKRPVPRLCVPTIN